MFVGEAPGGVEVDEGVPMVGPAGSIARAAVKTLGLPIPAISNAALCRPMKGNTNRSPNDREVRACSYWLEQAIAKAKPKVIVAMGNHACEAILGRSGIHALRGCIFRYRDQPIFVVPTWHPSYVMRARYSKFLEVSVPQEFLADLQMAKELPDEDVPENPQIDFIRTQTGAVRRLNMLGRQFSLDVEGTDQGRTILTIAFTDENGTFVIPVCHPESPLMKKGVFDFHVAAEIMRVMEDETLGKIGQNIHGYDVPTIERVFGCKVRGVIWDTMYGSHQYDERRGIHDLDMIASRFCKMGGYDWKLVQFRRELQGWKKESNKMYSAFMSELDKVPLDIIAEYNGLDAYVTYHAAAKQVEILTPQQNMLAQLVTTVAPVYHEMENIGIGFDGKYSRELPQTAVSNSLHLNSLQPFLYRFTW
jgi:uracil-DNA glycosylase family 4